MGEPRDIMCGPPTVDETEKKAQRSDADFAAKTYVAGPLRFLAWVSYWGCGLSGILSIYQGCPREFCVVIMWWMFWHYLTEVLLCFILGKTTMYMWATGDVTEHHGMACVFMSFTLGLAYYNQIPFVGDIFAFKLTACTAAITCFNEGTYC